MLIFILCILGLIFIAENVRELRTFRVKTYRITSHKLNGIKNRKIVFLSDLHNCSYGKRNGRLLAAVRKERPDLILIGGDMLVRRNGSSYADTLRFVSRLTSIAPVYYANGNHEQKLKEETGRYDQSYAAYKKSLTEAGVSFWKMKRSFGDRTMSAFGSAVWRSRFLAYEKSGKTGPVGAPDRGQDRESRSFVSRSCWPIIRPTCGSTRSGARS